MGDLMAREANLPAPARTNRLPVELAQPAEHVGLGELVSRMAARDERAFAEFYDATAGKAFGMARRIVRDPHLAEEVIADAYHQAWRDAGQYDSSRGSPLAWLMVICRSRALDALRARRSHCTRMIPKVCAATTRRPLRAR